MALLDYTYPELSFEALNTPVEDWRTLFTWMQTHGFKTLFDAGAGNALSAQVAQAEFPAIRVSAWEVVAERLQDIDCPNHDVRVADLFETPIPHCDVTFLYLPTGPLLERILAQLPHHAIIAAVESHGELFARLQEHAQPFAELPLKAKRHAPSMVLYRWQTPCDDLKQQLRQRTYRDTREQILVADVDAFEGEARWMADCYGASITPDGFVETIHPPRRFSLTQVVEITTCPWPNLIDERRAGFWRKIFLSPRALKETATGERIEINAKDSSMEKDR